MMEVHGRPAIYWVTSAARAAFNVDEVWLATTTEKRDDVLCEWSRSEGWLALFRGSEEDVLDRYYQCALAAKADVVVRLTGDCPLMDPNVLAETVALQHHTGLPYVSNVDPSTYPDGLDVQVMTMEALRLAWKEATKASDRDAVCSYIERNRGRFPSVNLVCPIPGISNKRWVLDTDDDLRFIREVMKETKNISYLGILETLRIYPELGDINKQWTRNERYFAKIAKEYT